jgi:hypothetical protein
MTSASRPIPSSGPIAGLALAILWLVVLLGACRTVAKSDVPQSDYDGWRFYCDAGGSLCLTVLEEDYSLILTEGESIPPQAEQHVVLMSPQGRHDIMGPNDLASSVSIATRDDAVEYLRFFSSWATVHLFEDQVLEIYRGRPGYLHGPKGECFICIPPQRWRDLGLESPQVGETPGGFLVTRYVVRPASDDPNAIDLYRIQQEVGKDGSVKTIFQTQHRGLTRPERYGLSFPAYL